MSITIYYSICECCGFQKYNRTAITKCPDCGSYDLDILTEHDEHEENE